MNRGSLFQFPYPHNKDVCACVWRSNSYYIRKDGVEGGLTRMVFTVQNVKMMVTGTASNSHKYIWGHAIRPKSQDAIAW